MRTVLLVSSMTKMKQTRPHLLQTCGLSVSQPGTMASCHPEVTAVVVAAARVGGGEMGVTDWGGGEGGRVRG